MSSCKILLIDDDETLLELLSGHLQMAGYETVQTSNAQAGLQMARQERPDLVILDVMMPGTDGWETCSRLRTESNVPIIMLTAKGEEFDKLRGFHLGVDDYVTKPFSFAEVVARIGAVLARARQNTDTERQVASGELIIDIDEHRVTSAGQVIELTPTEYRLLETLALRAHRTVPMEHLLDAVWGPQYAGEVGHVKHYIWTLRKKIEVDPGSPQHIITDRGFGYRFE